MKSPLLGVDMNNQTEKNIGNIFLANVMKLLYNHYLS